MRSSMTFRHVEQQEEIQDGHHQVRLIRLVVPNTNSILVFSFKVGLKIL